MNPGGVFVDKEFSFHDGAEAEKLFVVLGFDKGIIVVAKTTSKNHGRGITYGCQPKDRFHNFHLVANSCYLRKPTWICLDEFYELQQNKALAKRFSGVINHLCDLPSEMIKPLLECALQSDDMTAAQELIVTLSLKTL